MSRKVYMYLATGAVVFASVSGVVSEAKAAENVDVTAEVAGECVLLANPLSFGTYVSDQANPKNAEATVSYNCASGLDVTLTLSAGSSGNENARTMSSVTAFGALGYQLYQNAGRTTVWGSGTNGFNINPTPGGGAVDLTIYGQILGGLTVTPANDYTDLVVFDLSVN